MGRKPTGPPADHFVLQLLMLAVAGLPILLTFIGYAIGFPPRSITRPAFFAGGLVGIAGFAVLMLRGWRTERVWYPFVLGASALAGVMTAIALAAIGYAVIG